MKRIVRLLALVFTLSLALPAIADAADSLPPGFKAISDTKMNWAEAKAFCRQQGGRLPLIGGSNSLGSVSKGTSIDGFGTAGGPWPAGLPDGHYWTGSEFSFHPGRSWYVVDYGGNVDVDYGHQGLPFRVVCVP